MKVNELTKINLVKEFLDGSESNYEELIKKLTYILHEIKEEDTINLGRRSIDKNFFYDDLLKKVDDQFIDDVRNFEEAVSLSMEAFEGCIRWHHPDALFNITPSPLLDTVALTAVTSLYNPNGLWDMTSGKMILTEKKIIRILANQINWDSKGSGGIFTTGGKATLMYAIKMGLNRCDKLIIDYGVTRDKYVVIASERCHYSLEGVCSYLGLGKKSCIRVGTDQKGQIDLNALSVILNKTRKEGKEVACVILNGGGTMNLIIDPVKQVREVINTFKFTNQLGYTPYIHVDSVISWPWIFFNSDNFTQEKKEVSETILRKISRTALLAKDYFHADSFSADFHKTGLCPYTSSCIIVKNDEELNTIMSAESKYSDEDTFGQAKYYDRSLENSRSVVGIVNAYHTLIRFGRIGIREYIINKLALSERFQEIIRNYYSESVEVLNNESNGFEIVIKFNFGFITGKSKNILAKKDLEYLKTCHQFNYYINNVYKNSPIIGFIPSYLKMDNYNFPAFLIYPMAISFSDEDIHSILQRLVDAKKQFECISNAERDLYSATEDSLAPPK